MAILTGGSGDDYLIGTSGDDQLSGNGGADWIEAGGGNDTLIGGASTTPPIGDAPDFVLGSGFAIDEASLLQSTSFDLIANADIIDSTTKPHASSTVTNSPGEFYYFSVVAEAGQTITVDIDETADLDSLLYLYRREGNDPGQYPLVSWSDDDADDPGSEFSTDSRLTYTFQQQGEYILVIGSFFDFPPVEGDPPVQAEVSEGSSFTVHVSLDVSLEYLLSNKLFGGTGDDLYIVTAATDRIVELVSEGTDTVETGLGTGADLAAREANAYQLAANVENLTGTSNAGQGLVGNILGNLITAGDGDDFLRGGLGDDELVGGAGNDVLQGNDGFDHIEGGDGDDELRGNFNADTILGGEGNDQIFAGNGHDFVFGEDGNDTLIGALGRDQLTGGAGQDIFKYQLIAESLLSVTDKILDFTTGEDRIDLTLLDANAGLVGDQAFSFIGAAAFSGASGQLRAYDSGAGSWFVEGDINGDSIANFRIEVFSASTLAGADFFL